MISRLFWRLFVAILGVSILLIGMVSIYTARTLTQSYQDQAKANLLRLVRAIAINLEGQDPADLNQACKQIADQLQVRITVVDPSGLVLADTQKDPQTMEDHSNRPEIRQAVERGIGWASRYSPTLGVKMIYAATQARIKSDQLVLVRAAIPQASLRRSMAEVYTAMLTIATTAVGLAALLSWLIASQVSNPIGQIKAVAVGLSQGRLQLRAPSVGPAEVQTLAKTFNQMADQLQQRINIIEAQKAQLDGILAAMDEGLIAIDAEGKLLAANQHARPFLILPPNQAINRHYTQVVSNLDLQQITHRIITGAGQVNQQITTNDGRQYLIWASAFGGKPTGRGAVLLVHDITELRRLERIRKDFVANVSHELKTPITSIKGYVETLLEEMAVGDQPVRGYLEVLARHTERLEAIVEDLLTLARLEEDQEIKKISTEYLPLQPVLDEAVDLMAEKAKQKQIDIHLDCEPGLCARINRPLLVRAVTNLLDNAIKYSSPQRPVWINAKRSGNQIQISITDHGCGISQQHIPRIFERFYVVDKARSRQLGGTGLGLSIVKHIAHIHGGSVDVQSEPGTGSIFTINLPI